MAEELCSQNFWRLYHSLLRGGTDAEELERSRAVLGWAADNLHQIKAVCDGYELQLIGLIWDFWVLNKEAPNAQIVTEIAQRSNKNESMMAALEEYERLLEEGTLQRHDALAVSQILADKTAEFELERLNIHLETMEVIANGSYQDPKTKKDLSGANDAIQYFLNKLNEGLIRSRRLSRGGDLKEMLIDAREDYEKIQRASEDGTLTIRTGLNKLDSVIGGMRRGEFYGILGFAGTRKSTVGRSMAYNAACQGHCVVHVSLEHSFEEERTNYLILHATDPKFESYGMNISKKSYDEGLLTDQEKEFLFGPVREDFEKNFAGKIICKQPLEPSWEAIKAMVEFQHKIYPVDVLFIDYLMLVRAFTKNPTAEREAVILDAKQWAFSFGDGRGIAILTPVQGNRDGYDEAKKNDGKWEKSGIYMYSEFERSLDLLMYTYLDDDLRSADEIKVGTCKSRRSEDCPAYTYGICKYSGRIVGKGSSQSQGLAAKMDDVDQGYSST